MSSGPTAGSSLSSCAIPGAHQALQAVPVRYEHSAGLAELLERLGVSLLLSTYQAGRVVTVGSHQGELKLGFAHFDQAMGLCRTPTGVAVGCREVIWTLPANREIAPRLQPSHSCDIAFLARQAHLTGPVLGHELAWAQDPGGEGRLWLVNTLFNGLVTIEAPWSFVPRWKPPFISAWAPQDRCHLNGLALAPDGSGPAWVTALGRNDEPNGWRQAKATGGCLLHVPSGEVVLGGLAMPHSPRLYDGALLLLDSGRGKLRRLDPISGTGDAIASLPGFTRGLDCYAGHAFVGLSRIRETSIFGGLPLQNSPQPLRCGLAVVDLSSGALVGWLWFESGVEEIFAVLCLPGWRQPLLIGPNSETDATPSVWLVPPDGALPGPNPGNSP